MLAAGMVIAFVASGVVALDARRTYDADLHLAYIALPGYSSVSGLALRGQQVVFTRYWSPPHDAEIIYSEIDSARLTTLVVHRLSHSYGTGGDPGVLIGNWYLYAKYGPNCRSGSGVFYWSICGFDLRSHQIRMIDGSSKHGPVPMCRDMCGEVRTPVHVAGTRIEWSYPCFSECKWPGQDHAVATARVPKFKPILALGAPDCIQRTFGVAADRLVWEGSRGNCLVYSTDHLFATDLLTHQTRVLAPPDPLLVAAAAGSDAAWEVPEGIRMLDLRTGRVSLIPPVPPGWLSADGLAVASKIVAWTENARGVAAVIAWDISKQQRFVVARWRVSANVSGTTQLVAHGDEVAFVPYGPGPTRIGIATVP